MIDLTINGIPKAGCHALLKACELLGIPTGNVEHLTYKEKTERKYVFIIRDPRNILISWLRSKSKEVTQGNFISAFRRYDERQSFIEHIKSFLGWLSDPDTLVVRFENLIKDDKEMRRIADYLGVSYLDDAFENLPGLTRTWTGKYSDYQDIWTEELQKVWNEEGGVEIQKLLGY